jgi:SAM-dependent methyltransferase
MLVAAIIVIGLAVAFGGVLLFGAPYVPTLDSSAKAALELLDLRPGQTLLELGSGDGKMLVVAAQAGLNVVGIELNPLLVAVSWVRTRRYRKQVRIVWGNFWQTDWPECDAVYVFLLDRFMPKLDRRMQKLRKPLASLAFQIPDRKPDAEKSGVYVYRYSN